MDEPPAASSDPVSPGAGGPASAPRAAPYQPLVPAAAAFTAGILAAEYAGGGAVFWCAAGLLGAAGWAFLRWRRPAGRGLVVPLLVVLAAVGAARYRVATDPPARDVGALAEGGPRLVELEGLVVRSVRQSAPPADVFLPSVPYYVRSTLAVEAERVRLGDRWHGVAGRLRLSVRSPVPEDREGVPDLGARIRVTGVVRPPMPVLNPGGFDMAAYGRRQGIRAWLYTKHWAAVRTLDPRAAPLRWAVGRMRAWAIERLERLPSAEGRAVVAAVMFGRRDLLADEAGHRIEHAFVTSGTAHFLAVSGLHVGLVATVVLAAARLASLGRRPTAALVAVVVLAYALMTELRPSVVRAGVLVWLLCLGWAAGRRALRANSLAAAVLIVLAVRPGDLFTTGFQLSFAVATGLLLLADKVEVRVFRRRADFETPADPVGPGVLAWRWVRRTLAFSLAASLVSLPLVAHAFHLVAWLAPVGSVLLFPLVFLLLASGLVLVAVGWIAPWVADLVGPVPDGLARAVGGVAEGLAGVPRGHFYTSSFSWAWVAAVYVLLAAWAVRDRLGLSRRRLGLAALAVGCLFVWTTARRRPDHARATFLAVGNGCTTLLELPNGRNLLYDAGSAMSFVRAAETATAPALWSRGITRVDAILLSHAHFDHFKDVLPLVERFGVPRVFVPPTFMRERLASDDAVVARLLERGVAVEFLGPGDALAGTGDVAVRALWPRGPAAWTDEINDGSLVLAVEEGGRRLLLTGDLEEGGIAALLAAAPADDLRADAMLWPHHGGAPDAVAGLAGATGARTLVVSAARPHYERPVPDWARARGLAVLRTGDTGAVTVALAPEAPMVETFLAPATPEAGWSEEGEAGHETP